MDMNTPNTPIPAGPRIKARTLVRTMPKTIVNTDEPPIKKDDLRICPYVLPPACLVSVSEAGEVRQVVDCELILFQFRKTIFYAVNSRLLLPGGVREAGIAPDIEGAAKPAAWRAKR